MIKRYWSKVSGQEAGSAFTVKQGICLESGLPFFACCWGVSDYEIQLENAGRNANNGYQKAVFVIAYLL